MEYHIAMDMPFSIIQKFLQNSRKKMIFRKREYHNAKNMPYSMSTLMIEQFELVIQFVHF